MTTTPQPQQEAAFFTAIRNWGITRGPDGVIGGVVQGVGERVSMASTPARIIAVIAALVLTGPVLLTYAAAWALLPDREGNIIIQNFGRGVTNVGALIGIAVLTLFGLGGLRNPGVFVSPGDFGNWGDLEPFGAFLAVFFAGIVPLALLGGLIWLVVYLVRSGREDVAPGTPAAPPRGGAAAPVSHATVAQPAVSQPAVSQPVASHPVASPAVAPPPPTPYVPGPGKSFYLAALAWVFLSIAAIRLAVREDMLAINGGVAWMVLFTIGLGVLVMLVGLAGRRMGFLGFVATSMAAIMLIGLAADGNLRDTFDRNHAFLDFRMDADGDLEVITVFGEEILVDPASRFGEYDDVTVNGLCRNLSPEDVTTTPSDATVTIEDPGLVDRMDVDGDHITLISGDFGYEFRGSALDDLTVEYPDRGVVCTSFGDDGVFMRLAVDGENPTTIHVRDNGLAPQLITVKESS